MADRPRPESVLVRENARHNHVEQDEVRDEESHRRAHGRRYSRVGVPEATCRFAAPRGGGVQRRLGRQQQRDDPRAWTGPGQNHRRGVHREGTSFLHGHVARTHQKVILLHAKVHFNARIRVNRRK